MTITITIALAVVGGFIGGRLYEYERIMRIVQSKEFATNLTYNILMRRAEQMREEQNQN